MLQEGCDCVLLDLLNVTSIYVVSCDQLPRSWTFWTPLRDQRLLQRMAWLPSGRVLHAQQSCAHTHTRTHYFLFKHTQTIKIKCKNIKLLIHTWTFKVRLITIRLTVADIQQVTLYIHQLLYVNPQFCQHTPVVCTAGRVGDSGVLSVSDQPGELRLHEQPYVFPVTSFHIRTAGMEISQEHHILHTQQSEWVSLQRIPQ